MGLGNMRAFAILSKSGSKETRSRPTLNEKLPSPQMQPNNSSAIFLKAIIIPLWSEGTIWWDIRAGNFCVTERDGKQRLVLIDTDSLLAYADEIIGTPLVFTKRNHGKVTALKRIKKIVTDLVLSAIPEENLRGSKTKLELQIKSIINETLAPFEQPEPLQNGECFNLMVSKLDNSVRP